MNSNITPSCFLCLFYDPEPVSLSTSFVSVIHHPQYVCGGTLKKSLYVDEYETVRVYMSHNTGQCDLHSVGDGQLGVSTQLATRQEKRNKGWRKMQ
jgi:hypothetical protein